MIKWALLFKDSGSLAKTLAYNDFVESTAKPAFPMRTMQALVKRNRAPGLWLEEVPLPEIGEFDALIRVLRSSICGTDLHIYEWDSWAQRTIPTPMPIGHEFVGRIELLGRSPASLQQDQRRRGQSAGSVCGICCYSSNEHLGCRSGDSPRYTLLFRSSR